jgi:hypothetical protein
MELADIPALTGDISTLHSPPESCWLNYQVADWKDYSEKKLHS